MWMVVGLGNPGKEHEGQRHNVGFVVLDRLAARLGADIKDKKFSARLGRAQHLDQDIRLLAPMTYMNLSGESVGPALGFFRVKTDRLIVVHDELELPFRTVATKVGGGHGGHNGLRSLKQHLPDDRFTRIRFGIGRPPAGWDPADYVLSRFTAAERAELDALVEEAADAVLSTIERPAETHQPAGSAPGKSGRRPRGST